MVSDLIELLDISDSNKPQQDTYIDKSGKRQKVAGTRKKRISNTKKVRNARKSKKTK